MAMNPTVEAVTARIAERSRGRRQAYLAFVAEAGEERRGRSGLSCGNLAHAIAASGEDKAALRTEAGMNLAVVSAYNDMLSAHQPYGRYPEQIKLFAREAGATAQMAGGVPAMCDGVTQGRAGMELSLFSRDVIALSTAVALSHGVFDGVLLLGICDKIVPGLLIGALRFGHLPALFVPSGPMPSGIANARKQEVRQAYAEGKAGRDELLASEMASYHSPGTCTFYGTANSNQMLMEVMGLHVPGAAFVAPGTKLRQALTRAAVQRLTGIGRDGGDYRPLGLCVDERAIVNAIVGLLATGGSTNHAIHLPAIARAAGIEIDWQDFADLSAVTPLIARVYPNGAGDVNAFHAAGGMSMAIGELLQAGLLHRAAMTAGADDLHAYAQTPGLNDERLVWHSAAAASGDRSILRAVGEAFAPEGGLKLVRGNLGRAIFKTSAVDEGRWTIEAPAAVFDGQEAVEAAFRRGDLDRDVVVVVRFQGPRANGMPELHALSPALAVLQKRGHRVALVTDGRMSGASGSVPAAIHLWPEAGEGGPLARLRDGDRIRLCAREGRLDVLVDETEWAVRAPVPAPQPALGTGRELFALMRAGADCAERGASAMLVQAGL